MKVMLSKIFAKITTNVYIYYQKHLKKHLKLSSMPYISGDTFRAQSDHVLDDTSKIDPTKVKTGDILFVKTDYLDEFIQHCLPSLPDSLKLITHNSDINIEKNPFEDKLNNKSIYWFAQNLKIDFNSSQYIHPLPIGFENRNWLKNGKLSILKNTKITENKKDRILCAFNTSTNEQRIEILHNLDLNNNVDYLRRAKHKDYLRALSEYKLSVCPEGNGLDTHRIWESLLVETLPIVKKSTFTINLSSLGIPLMIIDDWKELQRLDKKQIEDIYSAKHIELKEKKYTKNTFWMEKVKKVFD